MIKDAWYIQYDIEGGCIALLDWKKNYVKWPGIKSRIASNFFGKFFTSMTVKDFIEFATIVAALSGYWIKKVHETKNYLIFRFYKK